MTIRYKTVLVTGANRGIGQALAPEALARGAKQVYVGARQPLPHPDDRVTPLSLDVTSTAQIQAATGQVESLDMLINNAGIARRNLPRSHLSVHGGQLARWRSQAARAPARTGGTRQLVSKGRG